MRQLHLLNTKRFAPFFWTQFLGAFNDNLYKNALVVLLTFQTASWTRLSPELLANLAAGVFILPFFLLSATAGQLADKYDKALLARLIKLLEVLIVGVIGLGFYLHSLALLLTALCLLGLQSALFGPVKYAILPQHLAENELVGGNALVETGTFVAILLGTLSGGILAGLEISASWIVGCALIVAIAGYVASRSIPPAVAPSPNLKINPNPLTETWKSIAFARENRTVFLSVLGISWFWLYGALLLAQFPVYARNVLGGAESLVTLMLAVFTVGIGAGSMLCERFSGKHVEIALIPFGMLGLALFGADLAMASPWSAQAVGEQSLSVLLKTWSLWRVLLDLVAIGLSGGFFVVPLYVLMQWRSAPEHRARIIAANNILNALFMVVGSITGALILGMGCSIPALFAIAALCNFLVAIYVCLEVPQHLIRAIAALLVRCFYRVEKHGLASIPDSGPAVLICNHVSFVDPVMIMAMVKRPIRFVVTHRFYRKPLIYPLLRMAKAIPIAPEVDDPVMKEEAFRQVAETLRAGGLVGLFPEGKLTRDGKLNRFRYGVQRIVKETPVPVIPLALRGLWGSFSSLKYGRALSRPDAIEWRRKVNLVAAAAVPPEKVSPHDLQVLVERLRGDE